MIFRKKSHIRLWDSGTESHNRMWDFWRNIIIECYIPCGILEFVFPSEYKMAYFSIISWALYAEYIMSYLCWDTCVYTNWYQCVGLICGLRHAYFKFMSDLAKRLEFFNLNTVTIKVKKVVDTWVQPLEANFAQLF